MRKNETVVLKKRGRGRPRKEPLPGVGELVPLKQAKKMAKHGDSSIAVEVEVNNSGNISTAALRYYATAFRLARRQCEMQMDALQKAFNNYPGTKNKSALTKLYKETRRSLKEFNNALYDSGVR